MTDKTFTRRKLNYKKRMPVNGRTRNFLIRQLEYARDIHKEWAKVEDKKWHLDWVYIYNQSINYLKEK
jgi:hypothetical protein